MAEDRYSWLDEDATERLLRGEPADVLPAAGGADRSAAARARRLSAVLSAVSDPARLPGGVDENGALPGEADALAAFRASRCEVPQAGAARPDVSRAEVSRADGPRTEGTGAAIPLAPFEAAEPGLSRPPGTGGPHRARLAAVVRRKGTGRRAPLGRPLRAGFAAALAGCALGGVAVAAGTGVLPTPFGHSADPVPTADASVAGPHSPHPSGQPTGGRDGGHGSPEATPHETGGADREPNSTGPGGAGAGTDRDGLTAGRGGVSPSDLPGLPGVGGQEQAAEVALCKKFRAGTLDASAEQRLEETAGGAGEVGDFCSQLLDEDDDTATGKPGADESDRNHPDRDEDSGKNGGGDGGGEDGGASESPPGTLQFSPREPVPSVEPAPPADEPAGGPAGSSAAPEPSASTG